MMRIEATIAPQTLPDVIEAVNELGGSGMTVTAVRSNLVGSLDWARYRANVQRRDFWLPAAFVVEVVLPEARLEEGIERLRSAISHSESGDGRILAAPLCGATRIRTGETGEDAVAR
jgi:nitrogen regulatory protein PII